MNNWAFNLDMLAQNGVIDFDAPAYIRGTKPRYAGNPVNPSPFSDYVPKGDNLKPTEKDGFSDTNPVKNPGWKKWLFGALAVGALAVGGYKFKNKLIPFAKNGWNKVANAFKWQGIKNFCKTKMKAVENFFKNGKITNLVKNGWSKMKNFTKNGWNKVKAKVNFPDIKKFCIDKAKIVSDFCKKGLQSIKGLMKK